MSRSRKSVVIIDDEKSYAMLLTELMGEHLDCRIDAFTRPREALAALPDLDVGVIVTDYCMPQMNGVQFITKASALVPGIPFILITGNPIATLDRIELARLDPLRAVLLKPFGWRRLAAEIIRVWPEPSEADRRGFTTVGRSADL